MIEHGQERELFALDLPEPWASQLCELAQEANCPVDEYASALLSSEIAKSLTQQDRTSRRVAQSAGAVIGLIIPGITGAIALGASLGAHVGTLAGRLCDTKAEEEAIKNALASLTKKLADSQGTIEALTAENTVLAAQLLHRTTDLQDAQKDNEAYTARLQWYEKQLRQQQEKRYRCPDNMRNKILAWVGECMLCGQQPPEVVLTIDRVIPGAQGGKYTWDNVQCLCFKCNRNEKGEKTGDGWDFRKFFPDFEKKCQDMINNQGDQGDLFSCP